MKKNERKTEVDNNHFTTAEEEKLIAILKRLRKLIEDSDVKSQNVDEDTIVFPDCELYDDLPF